MQPNSWMKGSNSILVQSELWSQLEHSLGQKLCVTGVLATVMLSSSLKQRSFPFVTYDESSPQVTVLQANSLIWDEFCL